MSKTQMIQKVEKDDLDTTIRCRGCGKLFDLATCEMLDGTLPNTFNDLVDHESPHAQCPHCGYAS